MEASCSAAEGLSRSKARLRRRAHRASKDGRLSTPYGRVLDSPSAAEVPASIRSTARWVGGGGRQTGRLARPPQIGGVLAGTATSRERRSPRERLRRADRRPSAIASRRSRDAGPGRRSQGRSEAWRRGARKPSPSSRSCRRDRRSRLLAEAPAGAVAAPARRRQAALRAAPPLRCGRFAMTPPFRRGFWRP
jgi:hypothetical protein